MTGRPITEDELQAYVDGAIEGQRTAEVVAYLAKHPDVGQRIGAYAEQRILLRQALQSIADEPVPPELNLTRLLHERSTARRWRSGIAWRAAAAAALLSIGGAGGWALHGPMERPQSGIAALADEAADSYAVYAPDLGRPVEIKASDQAQLVKWASSRLERPVAVPNLSAAGFELIGGRVVPTPHGPAALYMFDNGQGVRLVMLTRKMALDRDAPMREGTSGSISSVSWSRDGLGYSLVGPLAASVLHPIADAARRQFSNVS
ncbi:anti-sigma factor [Sphingomonas sp. So64.6b]|uniref:anti-sigma factor family protein n=1 Tax=Sphingomonas sp. So64.6b TaxID=2997354 RepID=UPI001603F0A9|nr:anti-sigma factor [Sphingomonas sp. So64.6b]QNA85488.1 anti-sigma factor [Sphingomonas sp. So64.6b]